MSGTRSNSTKKARKPLSAYAKLRKQRYDKQYQLDIALFGYSRHFERMRETGRYHVTGLGTLGRKKSCQYPTQLRNEFGQFTGRMSHHQPTTDKELDLFVADLVGMPSSVRFCRRCSQERSNCSCWDELSRSGNTLRQLAIRSLSESDEDLDDPDFWQSLSDAQNGTTKGD
jgi:hypothetical protein